MFSVSGNQGQHWEQAEISIYGSLLKSDYIIRIVGESGGFSSDIAIDDVTVASGLCSLEGLLFCDHTYGRHVYR